MPENGKSEDGPLQSIIVISFAAPGSAEFRVDVENAGPPQLLAAAEFLRLMAARQLNDQWTAQAMATAQQQQEMSQVQRMLSRGKFQ